MNVLATSWIISSHFTLAGPIRGLRQFTLSGGNRGRPNSRPVLVDLKKCALVIVFVSLGQSTQHSTRPSTRLWCSYGTDSKMSSLPITHSPAGRRESPQQVLARNRVLMKLSAWALSYGVANRLMLMRTPCCSSNAV